ncbi:uncharacterized protein LOC132163033 [Corylus avellana]|uniref:uncharacterized protein LOC132163033 n=1 Tax=Corylus avellana TaxID=13451 RepID=UPI00286C578B|nr:uncharacterized protein LOC132163033 [Corylus avellana]
MASMFSAQILEAFRKIYGRLVTDLGVHPIQSQHVIAFWNWLEFQPGNHHFLFRIISWPDVSLKVVFKEALVCLFYLRKEGFPLPFDMIDRCIPLTRSVFRETLSFRNLYAERKSGQSKMTAFNTYVCERAFTTTDHRMLPPPNSSNPRQFFQAPEFVSKAPGAGRFSLAKPRDTTFFLTGSPNNPLSPTEVQDFIARYKNCLETTYMDEPPKMLHVYAFLVVRSPSDVERILGGNKSSATKFSVNGKDVWMKLLSGLTHSSHSVHRSTNNGGSGSSSR